MVEGEAHPPRMQIAGSRAGFVDFIGAALWILVVGSAIPLGGAGSSAGPHIVGLSLLTLWLLASGKGPGKMLWPLLLLLAGLLAHFMLASTLTPCHDLLSKSIATQIMLAWVLLGCAVLANSLKLIDVGPLLVRITVLVTLSVLLDKAWLVLSGASALIRPSGIYLEPSHLALAVSPLLAALVTSTRPRERLIGWCCALLLFLLSGSGTLFIVLTLCLALALMSMRHAGSLPGMLLRVLLMLVGVAALIWLSPFRDAFVERIAGVATLTPESNMSSVVYVAGWQMAQSNLEASGGLGLGLNRMGCEPRPVTEAGAILEMFDLDDGNYNDGSFTFAKVISELGWLGVALWALLARVLWRAVQRCRACEGNQHRTLRLFLISAAAVLVLGSLVRGTGYFAPTFVLGMLALLMLQREDLWQ